MSLALVAGALFAVAALAYVLVPVFTGRRRRGVDSPPSSAAPSLSVTDEEIEAAVRAYRARSVAQPACDACGPRPEADALFCSQCGRRVGLPAPKNLRGPD